MPPRPQEGRADITPGDGDDLLQVVLGTHRRPSRLFLMKWTYLFTLLSFFILEKNSFLKGGLQAMEGEGLDRNTFSYLKYKHGVWGDGLRHRLLLNLRTSFLFVRVREEAPVPSDIPNWGGTPTQHASAFQPRKTVPRHQASPQQITRKLRAALS